MDFEEMDNASTTDDVGEADSAAAGEIGDAQSTDAGQPSDAPRADGTNVGQRRTRLAALRGPRAKSANENLPQESDGAADAATGGSARGLGIRDLAKPGAASDPIEAGRSVLARLTKHLSEDPSKARTAFRSALASVQRGYDALDKEIARLRAELARAEEAMRTLQGPGD
jgi:hypothetical protein